MTRRGQKFFRSAPHRDGAPSRWHDEALSPTDRGGSSAGLHDCERLDGGRLRVHPGEAAAADVTLVQTREVAAAFSRGELNAQQALEAGRLKLRGDIGHLAREGRALTAVADLFAAVRAATTY